MFIVIGGGLFQTYAIKKAKSLGLKVVCVDMNPNAQGAKEADEFINISTKDHQSICDEIRKRNFLVDGVITVGTDMSESVYYISKEFWLDPGFKDYKKVVNKIEMRKALQEKNVPQPKFTFSTDCRELIENRKKAGLSFPLVIKPAQSMGARGVKKVLDDKQIETQFYICKEHSFDKRVILEEYMSGPEVSVESLIVNGKYCPMVIGDRHIEKEPFFIETGHSCPSRLSKKDINEINRIMELAANALQIHNAPAKGDIKITKKGVMVGEIAARLSGGFMSSHTLPLSTGIDAIKLAIEQRLGLIVDVKPTIDKYPVCIERAIYSEEDFVIKKIKGVKEAQEIEGVKFLHFNLKEGDQVSPLTSNIGKIANVIIAADSFEKAEKTFEKVKSELCII